MSRKIVDTWSASEYNNIASFVYSAEYTAPILTLLDPRPGEKIIDFGCGSGDVTLEISKVVTDAGLVVGIDSSQSMVNVVILSTKHYLFFSQEISDRQGERKRTGKRPRPRHSGAER